MGAGLLALTILLLLAPLAHAAPPQDWAGRKSQSGVDPLMLQTDRWPGRADFWRDVRNGAEGTVNQPSPRWMEIRCARSTAEGRNR